ncbi:dTMP kinase [Candidatus Gracilibacteria bacterium CG2_30_37_12]|nr:MAG: dTMP kinase [Candidatus Gracilibacteria bacterium CG2_30_37_12]
MYIVFEGMVGSGKSTQSKKLFEYLKAKYPTRNIIHVREPGSTIIAQEIRLLAQSRVFEEDMHHLTEAYLYAAARAQLLNTVVKPTIEAGGIVVADRSFVSSLANQGEARGLGLDIIMNINKEAVGNVLPDMVFCMHIDVDESLTRTSDATGDKFEKLGREFYEGVQRGYEKASKLPILEKAWRTIDSHGTQDQVFAKILNVLPENM